MEIEDGVTPAQLQGALQAIADANAEVATPLQIAKGLAVLAAVCAKPADFDDAKVVLWSERLKVVLQEYPADIALHAISDWPKTDAGKWWPTENELRKHCAELMRFRSQLRAELEHHKAFEEARLSPPAETYNDGMESEPSGNVREFVEAVYARNPALASAYLTNARYGEDRIGVRYAFAAESLERLAPGLQRQLGVRIVTPRAFTVRGEVEWPE